MVRVENEDLPVPPKLELGVYEHYKGRQYEVIGVGLDTETLEPVVIYKPLYASNVPLWVRSHAMFTETITVGSKTVKRFRKH